MGKLKELIVYFVEHYPGPLSRTELVKLVYLADVICYSIYNRSLSGETFVRYHYGPYCEAIPLTADELAASGIIAREISYTHYGDLKYEYSPVTSRSSHRYALTAEEEWIAAYVVGMTSFLTLDDIKRLAYETPPMVELLRRERDEGRQLLGEVLDMTTLRREPPRRSLKVIKQAFKKVDLSHRGSDEEYARVVEEEARALEPYRKRAEAVRV